MGCASSTQDKSKMAGGGQGGGMDDEDDFNPLTEAEVKDRIVCCPEAQLFQLGKTGVTLRYAYLSQRGYYPEDLYKANQDAFKIVPNFNGKKDQIFFGVFDGHGQDGDSCSYFVRDNIEAELKRQMAKYPDDFERAYKESFLGVNMRMHSQEFDDSMSGTTAITAFFVGTQFTVANIGDSRAVVGEKKGKRVIAYSLSIDQTPYRQDERERIKAAGAVVMSCDQLEGLVPYHENWGVNLGEELDNGGDPPRVWAQGKSFPGCAFTRSIGDSVAESIGVSAEPELLRKELTEEDVFVVLASDGVWEFLTNQSVTDMILKFTDPLDACRAVVAESYRLWLQYEVRTDDITMILAFVDVISPDQADREQLDSMRRRRSSRRGSADQISVGLDIVGRAGGENRPVRRGLSKEKKKDMAIASASVEDDEPVDLSKMEVVPKTPEEIARIKAAVKANFLFSHLNASQAKLVYDVMKRVKVRKGDKIIQEGEKGEWFYVVDEGEYAVTIKGNEIMKYTTLGGTNPCFGELALMYSKPRAATVVANTDGLLWAMDRKSFRSILMKSSSTQLTKTLRSVEVLKSLSIGQLQRLQDVLTEQSFNDGEYIIRQGDESENLYIIDQGRVRITRQEEPGQEARQVMELGPYQYFGERALLYSEPRAANVIANSQGGVKLLYISKDAFEEVLGSLQEIIDSDRQYREKLAMDKQLQLEAEGLTNITVGDFTFEGVACVVEPCQYALAKIKGREYTIKTQSKAKVVSMSLASRIMEEKELALTLVQNQRFVPVAMTTLQDNDFLYTVFKARIATDLATLIGETAFDEKTAMFYTASVALALEHLHSDQNKIIYRNLTADAIVIDDNGYVQLMDMRYAVKVEPPPTDFCGYPHYLSPEQVASQGHGPAADFWALGILTYEMITSGNPWLTGDPAKDSEVGLYQRISAHVRGKLLFPDGVSPSGALVELLNDLLEPVPEKRLGYRGVGPRGVRQCKWLEDFAWEKLEAGKLDAPHAAQASKAYNTALKDHKKPVKDSSPIDSSWDFSSFSSFWNSGK